MKITKTFYYQYGSQYPTQDDYQTTVAPADILDTLSASIYINIPFKVKKIHVKNITYVSGQNGGQGNAACQNYVSLTSSLVGNRPVGMVYRDNQFSMATIQDVEHIFQLPEVINGYYDFTFYTNNGNPYKYALGYSFPFYDSVIIGPPDTYRYWFDSFSITMEFNSEEEVF
jgi:hypothetical protein